LLRTALHDYPVVVVTGARQAGKSTLLRQTLPDWQMLSLEDLDVREFAHGDPRAFLQRHPAPLIIDEAQRVPQLLSYIQTAVDGSGRMGQYVLSGSQQFSLLAGVTQSLAGRASFIEMHGLRLKELADGGSMPESLDRYLLQGGYPAVHARQLDTQRFYADYVASYVERDVRGLSAVQDLGNFQRFMRLCAARSGQLLNLNALANDCGIAQPTANESSVTISASSSGSSRSASPKSLLRESPIRRAMVASATPSRSTSLQPRAAAAMRRVASACPTSCWQ